MVALIVAFPAETATNVVVVEPSPPCTVDISHSTPAPKASGVVVCVPFAVATARMDSPTRTRATGCGSIADNRTVTADVAAEAELPQRWLAGVGIEAVGCELEQAAGVNAARAKTTAVASGRTGLTRCRPATGC
jgi:hypothetical protein